MQGGITVDFVNLVHIYLCFPLFPILSITAALIVEFPIRDSVYATGNKPPVRLLISFRYFSYDYQSKLHSLNILLIYVS